MAKVGKFIHVAGDTTDKTSVGTSYATSKAQAISMASTPLFNAAQDYFKGHLEYIRIHLTSISTATKITFKLCADSNGDVAVTPSTELIIDIGTTTATVGDVSAKIDVPIYITGADTIYLFTKTDAGTVTIDESQLVWSE